MQRLLAQLTTRKRFWGYFISEFSADQHQCVLAFRDARSAVAWALRFPKELAGIKFNRQLSTWYLTAMHAQGEDFLFDPDCHPLFQGILPAIGMHTAPCSQAVMHRVMRQQIVRYKGELIDISAALAATAAPGQVRP